jgi:thioredoxin-related protein
MSRKIPGLIILLLLSLAACRSDSGPSSESIKWYSYDEGTQLGEKEGKKVVLNFYADWCTFCAKMDKETFNTPEIVTLLNQQFISIKVNKDKQEEIARKYFVRGLPMTWFMEPDGDKISSLPGYIPPEMFMQILKFIDSGSYNDMTFKEYVDSL